MNNKISDIAFLFDLDGVILDSERRYSKIWYDIEQDYPTGITDFPRVIKGTTLHDNCRGHRITERGRLI